MNVMRGPRPSVLLPGLLVLFAAMPASAQVGGLRNRLQRGAQAGEAPPGTVRAKATIEWTFESSEKGLQPGRRGMQESAETSKEQGTLTATIEIPQDQLPGGPTAQMMEAQGGYAIMAGGGAEGGSAKLISASGSVSYERKHQDLFKADCTLEWVDVDGQRKQEPALDALTAVATGRGVIEPGALMLILQFRGEKPIGLGFTPHYWIKLTSKTTSSCGAEFGKTAPDSTMNVFPQLNLEIAPAGWTFQQGGSPGRYTLVARSVARSDTTAPAASAGTLTRTITFTWEAPPAPKGPQMAPPPSAPSPSLVSAKGSITFTQNGKEATWPLNSVTEANAPGGVSSLTLMYTPDGAAPSEQGVLGLSVVSVMGQTMVGLTVNKGPAGDSTFETEMCTAQVSPPSGKSLQGSGECRDGNEVVKFRFTATR